MVLEWKNKLFARKKLFWKGKPTFSNQKNIFWDTTRPDSKKMRFLIFTRKIGFARKKMVLC